MTLRLWCLDLAVALLVLLAGLACQAQRKYDWDERDLPDPSTWASYFRQHARLRLGPEQRLPNGVASRLVTDTESTIAMPRLTWKRDRRRLLAANRLACCSKLTLATQSLPSRMISAHRLTFAGSTALGRSPWRSLSA